MDGNGRWAQQRGLTRIEGHKRGKDSVRAVVETARRLGISYLSLFAFSTENWSARAARSTRSWRLLRRYLRTELRKMMKNEIRLRGDRRHHAPAGGAAAGAAGHHRGHQATTSA